MSVDSITQSDRAPAVDTVSLRDYVDSRLVALDVLSKNRCAALELEIKRIDQLSIERLSSVKSASELYGKTVEAQFEGVRAASLLSKESLNQQFASISSDTAKSTTSLDKRLEGMNEFREQMNDMASKFITRADVETNLKYIADRMASLEHTVSNTITRQELVTQLNAAGDRLSALEKFSNNMQGRMWVIAAVVVIIESEGIDVHRLQYLRHSAQHVSFAAHLCPFIGLIGALGGILFFMSNSTALDASHLKEVMSNSMSGIGIAFIPTIVGVFSMIVLSIQCHLITHSIGYVLKDEVPS